MQSPPFLRIALALGITGALATPSGPAAAQESSPCRGWTVTCAAVDVRVEGDQLILFSPNGATPGGEVPEAPVAASPVDRVAVLADRPGAVCDAATGVGCRDVTGAWAPVASEDTEARECRERVGWRGGIGELDAREEEEDECRSMPLGAFFVVALPAGLYVLGPDGHAPLIEDPLPGDPEAGLPDPGEPGSPGEGSPGGNQGGSSGGDDDGSSGGDDDGSSGGDDGGSSGGEDGGSSGGDDGGSSGGDDGGSSGGDDGGSSGGDDGGSSGGDDSDDGSDSWDGGLGLPPEQPRPPMSEVPEPISTTLFGLGLAGYAGAQLKKRRAARLDGDEELA